MEEPGEGDEIEGQRAEPGARGETGGHRQRAETGAGWGEKQGRLRSRYTMCLKIRVRLRIPGTVDLFCPGGHGHTLLISPLRILR